MSETLKPCPFCGGEAEIERYGTRGQSTIYSCTDCSCSLETSEEWGHGRSWNARPASPAQPVGERREALEALATIGRIARSDGDRTFDDTIRDLGLIDDLCRALLSSDAVVLSGGLGEDQGSVGSGLTPLVPSRDADARSEPVEGEGQ